MTPPPLDLDWQLRLAAFDALGQLTDRSGGVITREQMTAGFEFQGGMVPFALRARGIWKPARLGKDGAALSITTASIRRNVTPRYDDVFAVARRCRRPWVSGSPMSDALERTLDSLLCADRRPCVDRQETPYE